jgi:23S rRNA (adenine1618-N6)-methyltransferase
VTEHRSHSQPTTKSLHPRNLHNQDYDFAELIKHAPQLAQYVSKNSHGTHSIDFADPEAVKTLNASLLDYFYHIKDWTLPSGALCSPIPGRVDYIHYIADFLNVSIPKKTLNSSLRLLDIGTGANGIYALLASQIYQWQCVASDINKGSLENVASILTKNSVLDDRITLRHQTNRHHIFEGIIDTNDQFDIVVCNPPFHSSKHDALQAAQRKVRNLSKSDTNKRITPTLNFGGFEDELWCNGGEHLFLKKMIKESLKFGKQCRWFSSLVSKSETLKPLIKLLNKQLATQVKQIEMSQGNKKTRILLWTYT